MSLGRSRAPRFAAVHIFVLAVDVDVLRVAQDLAHVHQEDLILIFGPPQDGRPQEKSVT